MPWLCLLIGALVGVAFFGMRGLAAGAAIGIVAGLLLKRSSLMPAASASPDRGQGQRIALLEQRVAALEAALGRAAPVTAPSGAAAPAGTAPATPPVAKEPTSGGLPASTPAPAFAPVRKGGAGERVAETPPGSTGAATTEAASLWAWFTDGNTLARIGIVVLFFGIAFLLSYLAEHVSVPIELQFAAVALAGAALIAVGAWLRNRRRAYALALIGGGVGVLYLTAFAALELVPLLSPGIAFVLLAAISALAIILALIFDAQALAALATIGGLLAPVLVEAVTEPLPLFGYVAFVNVVVLFVAWFRAWRALDLAGFVGTFLLSLWWGQEYYDSAYLGPVEPFLLGFFAAYVAVPIVHAWRGASERRVDAVLVFGVPMVAFALQALLVHDIRYALAWSAAAVARCAAPCSAPLSARCRWSLRR
jgi:uncharacterized membrane protein